MPILPVKIKGYNGNAMEPFISRDSSLLFFNNRNDGSENCNIFYAAAVPGDPLTFVYKGLISADTVALEGVASMDFAGNFFFITNRQPPNTIYQGKWVVNGNVGVVAPIKGVNFVAPQFGMDAEISNDGQTLYYAPAEALGAGFPQASLTTASRNWDGTFTPAAVDLFAAVNAVGTNYAPATTPDELNLFFTRYDVAQAATPQIYVSMRASKTAVWGAPTVIPLPGYVEGPSIRSDGTYLYYHQQDPVTGKFTLSALQF